MLIKAVLDTGYWMLDKKCINLVSSIKYLASSIQNLASSILCIYDNSCNSIPGKPFSFQEIYSFFPCFFISRLRGSELYKPGFKSRTSYFGDIIFFFNYCDSGIDNLLRNSFVCQDIMYPHCSPLFVFYGSTGKGVSVLMVIEIAQFLNPG